jgi:hypothetical protein
MAFGVRKEKRTGNSESAEAVEGKICDLHYPRNAKRRGRGFKAESTRSRAAEAL